MAIYFYPLTIVPKQKREIEKPRGTTVESVDIVPAKLHTHMPIIAPVARIRVNSLRTVDKKVVRCAFSFSSAVMVDSTGKPSRATSLSKCTSQGFDNPRSHLETAFPEIGAPLSSIISLEVPYRFLVCGNYTAFYKVDGDEVHIIRVLYGRRNFMQILFGKSYDE